MKDIILNTLNTNQDKVNDYQKYEIVLNYLQTNEEEILLHILNTAIMEYQNNSSKYILDLLQDINFCIDAAYEYIYFKELNNKANNKTR